MSLLIITNALRSAPNRRPYRYGRGTAPQSRALYIQRLCRQNRHATAADVELRYIQTIVACQDELRFNPTDHQIALMRNRFAAVYYPDLKLHPFTRR